MKWLPLSSPTLVNLTLRVTFRTTLVICGITPGWRKAVIVEGHCDDDSECQLDRVEHYHGVKSVNMSRLGWVWRPTSGWVAWFYGLGPEPNEKKAGEVPALISLLSSCRCHVTEKLWPCLPCHGAFPAVVNCHSDRAHINDFFSKSHLSGICHSSERNIQCRHQHGV